MHGSQSLDPTCAFTALSLVMLLTGLVGNLIHAVPLFQTALASVDRIRAFLELDEVLAPDASINEEFPSTHRARAGGPKHGDGIELEAINTVSGEHSTLPSVRQVIGLTHVFVHLGNERKPVLRDVSVNVPDSSLTLIIGPV